MRIYIDTEFHEYEKLYWFCKPVATIELISIGLTNEKGERYYAISKEFNVNAAWGNQWLRENVLRHIFIDLYTEDNKVIRDDNMEFTYNALEVFSKRNLKKLVNKYGLTRQQIAEGVYDFINPHIADYTEVQPNPYYDEDNAMSGDPYIEVIKDGYVPNEPEFWGYYADYDWVVFCWLYGRMIDLPDGYPMFCRDLKQLLDETCEKFSLDLDTVKTLPDYPKQDGEHHALDDALWNKNLHDFLTTLIKKRTILMRKKTI